MCVVYMFVFVFAFVFMLVFVLVFVYTHICYVTCVCVADSAIRLERRELRVVNTNSIASPRQRIGIHCNVFTANTVFCVNYQFSLY